MQNTETGYASSVNVTKSRTRRKVTGEPRTLKGVRVVRRGGARKRVSHSRETPRRAPYPVLWSYRSGIRTSASTNSDHGGEPARRPRLTGTMAQCRLGNHGSPSAPFGP